MADIEKRKIIAECRKGGREQTVATGNSRPIAAVRRLFRPYVELFYTKQGGKNRRLCINNRFVHCFEIVFSSSKFVKVIGGDIHLGLRFLLKNRHDQLKFQVFQQNLIDFSHSATI